MRPANPTAPSRLMMKAEIDRYKRDRIIEAASDLFYERGFARTTLDAIAERIGSNKPFIYQFFESKHELLAEVIADEVNRVIKLLDEFQSREKSARDQLYGFISAWVAENIEFRKFAVIFWQEYHHFTPEIQNETRKLQKILNRRLIDLIERGRGSGEFHVDNPRLAAFALAGLAQWIPRWYRPEGDIQVAEIREYFAAQALRIVGCNAPTSELSEPT
jgi:AcrR family transcriptional regulator